MRPAKAGDAMVDGVAVGPEGERIAIEVRSPRDDIVRVVGQCFGALAAGTRKTGYYSAIEACASCGRLRRRFWLRQAEILIQYRLNFLCEAHLFLSDAYLDLSALSILFFRDD